MGKILRVETVKLGPEMTLTEKYETLGDIYGGMPQYASSILQSVDVDRLQPTKLVEQHQTWVRLFLTLYHRPKYEETNQM